MENSPTTPPSTSRPPKVGLDSRDRSGQNSGRLSFPEPVETKELSSPSLNCVRPGGRRVNWFGCADAYSFLAINRCQYQVSRVSCAQKVRPNPRYRYRFTGAVQDLEQKPAWELFVREIGIRTRKGRSIVPGAFLAVFLYQMPVIVRIGAGRCGVIVYLAG